MTNVLRQLFGAFGTAMFATLLQDRQSYHNAMLGQDVTPDLPAIHAALAGVQIWLTAQGMPLAEAKAAAVMVLQREVATRAAVRGFDDCFLIATAICVFGIVPAFFLRTKGVQASTRSVALD